MISHQIQPSPTFSSYNVIIRCDIPIHLLPSVLNSDQFTNITVSLLTPRYLPSVGVPHEIFEIDSQRRLFPNLNLNASSCIIEALPVCSTFEVNTVDEVNLGSDLNSNLDQIEDRKKSIDLWHSKAYSPKLNESMDDTIEIDFNHPERSPLRRNEFKEYKYNISACVLVYGLKMDHNIEHELRFDQIEVLIRDWINYHHHILGIEHFIFYEHFPTKQVIEEKEKEYIRKYGVNQTEC